MLATRAAIESLAGRIERAYRLRRPRGFRGEANSGVWTAAASLLYRIHQEDPNLPLDPELFVAVQPGNPTIDDPWSELAQPGAARLYRSRIRRIVRQLQAELRGELLRAEGRIRRGEGIVQVLQASNKNVSPLGCYLVALRAGRTELAARFRAEAAEQHQSCPLYRQAILRLLPPEDYPVVASLVQSTPPPTQRYRRPQVHLN